MQDNADSIQGNEEYTGDEPEVDPPTLEEWSRAASSMSNTLAALGRKSLGEDDLGARRSMDWPALRNSLAEEEGVAPVGGSGRRGTPLTILFPKCLSGMLLSSCPACVLRETVFTVGACPIFAS